MSASLPSITRTKIRSTIVNAGRNVLQALITCIFCQTDAYNIRCKADFERPLALSFSHTLGGHVEMFCPRHEVKTNQDVIRNAFYQNIIPYTTRTEKSVTSFPLASLQWKTQENENPDRPKTIGNITSFR